jgi:hypothetical protein
MDDRNKAMDNWKSIGLKKQEFDLFGFKELIYSSDRVEKWLIRLKKVRYGFIERFYRVVFEF